MLLVIGSGILLQVKKQVPWVQPPTKKGSEKSVEPSQNWGQLFEAVSAVQEAEVTSWQDIDRIDVRPSKGVAKVQCKNSWEVQLDLANSEVLSVQYRRSDLIESLHDGSFFSDSAKLWLFLPNGLILLGLWGTGIWLWYLPFSRRKKR